nr:mannose-1-phosphate guanylyltransferase/mannose-6-phosphate isomerase [uncultured Halomonas sp.]
MTAHCVPVILAGGSGTRLWPLSRRLRPKQFLALGGIDDTSLLQRTLARLDGLGDEETSVAAPIVVCGEEHRFLAAEQLRQSGLYDATLMIEPEGRNTAPSLTVAAFESMRDGRDPLLVVLPADHAIADEAALHAALNQALALAGAGWLVTLGVTPTRAETGYGYLRRGEAIVLGGHRVAAFIEKPDAARAETFLASSDYLWNSGVFVLRASAWLAAVERFAPMILAACREAWVARRTDLDFLRLDREAFLACPADSIDYAVMERAADIAMVTLDAGWNDLGDWQALWRSLPRDADGNSAQGDVMLEGTRGCLVQADSRLVATLGVENLVVVETADAVLVAALDHTQRIKALVARLDGREEIEQHPRVLRPWGDFRRLDRGRRFQVKHITVKPGEGLSLQRHHHRAEHWVVVAGTARVTNGERSYLVTENQSTYVPIGQVHSLENPGRVPLELIEIQSGGYLGEDDIERLADRYGRDATPDAIDEEPI